MSGFVVISGNSGGLIYRRTSPGTWALEHTVAGGSGGVRSLQPRLTNNQSLYGIVERASDSVSLNSSDDGGTWTETAAFTTTSDLRIAQDASGNLYTVNSSGNIIKSTDNGETWASIGNGGATSGVASNMVTIQDEYIWFIANFPDDETRLHRCDLDGTNGTSFALGLGTGSNGRIVGLPGTHHLCKWRASNEPYEFINITDPAVPTVTAYSAKFGGDSVCWMVPVTSSVALALTCTPGIGTQQGSIWKSTDSGATWTRKAGPNSRIQKTETAAQSYHIAPCLSNLDLIAIPGICVDDSVGPYNAGAWISTDRGETWAEETVFTHSAGSLIATHWTSIAISGSIAAARRGTHIAWITP